MESAMNETPIIEAEAGDLRDEALDRSGGVGRYCMCAGVTDRSPGAADAA